MPNLPKWQWDRLSDDVTEAGRNKLRSWLKQFPEEPAQWFNGLSSKTPDRLVARRVSSKILTVEGLGDSKRLELHHTLVSMVRAYNVANASYLGPRQRKSVLALPWIPLLITPEPTINTPELYQHRQLHQTIQEFLNRGNYEDMSDNELLGAFALSAMVNGALLSPNSIYALIRQTLKRTAFVSLCGTIVCELHLQLPYGGSRTQHWYPDIATTSLFFHLNKKKFNKYINKPAPDAWKCISSLLDRLSIDSPSSLQELSTAMSLAWMFELPPVLVRYMQGKGAVVSQTFKTEKFDQPRRQVPINQGNDGAIPVPKGWRTPVDVPSEATGLMELIEELDRDKAQIPVSTVQSQVHWYCLDWLRHTVNKTISGDIELVANVAGIAPQSIKGAFWRVIRVMRVFSTIKMEAFSKVDAELNSQIMSACMSLVDSFSTRRTVAKALYAYYQHLIHQHNFPKLSDSSMLDIRKAEPRVDANLVTHDDWTRIKTFFSEAGPVRSGALTDHVDMPRAALLIATLGFRAGLRSHEAWGLQLCDLIGNESQMTLLVRDNEIRDLKTINGTRQLPLHTLLATGELEELIRWRERAHQLFDQPTGQEPLFALQARQNSKNPSEKDRYFRHIRAALSAGTQDKSIRFHTLRHSAASWWLLAMFSHEYGVPDEEMNFCPASRTWLQENTRAIYEAFLGTGQMTPSTLYALARNCGHASPETTLKNYVHTMDIIVAHARKSLPRPKMTAISHITSKTLQQLQRYSTASDNEFVWYLIKTGPGFDSVRALANNRSMSVTGTPSHFQRFRHQLLSLRMDSASTDDETNEGMAERARRLAQAQNNSSRKLEFECTVDSDGVTRQTLMPKAPWAKGVSEETDRIIDRVMQMAKKSGGKEIINRGLEAYLHAKIYSHATVIFSDTQHGREFVQLLTGMGYPLSALRLSLLHGRNRNRAWCSEAKSIWSSEANIPKRYILLNPIRERHAQGEIGHLSVDVIKNDKALADAVHYAMRLTYINFN